MGIFAQAVRALGGFLPEHKTSIGATIPSWESGTPQNPRYGQNYYRFAKEGYSANEIVFACFPAGAPVTLADGTITSIELLNVGDCVRTHTGQKHPVSETIAVPYTGDFYSIKRVGRTDPIEATAGHPFFIARKPENPRHWFGYAGRARRKTGRKLDSLTYFWADADQIQKGDYLLEPVPTEVLDRTTYGFDREQAPGKRSRLHTPSGEVDVTDDLLKLIGYYLAEGYGGGRSVHFAFHRKETTFHADVQALMATFFHAETRHYADLEHGQTRVLTFNSSLAAAFFGQFGRGAKNKAIPDWIMMLPPEKQAWLLLCFHRGDGCATKTGFNFSTASRSLAEQIHILLLRQGIVSSVRTGRSRTLPPAATVAKARTLYTVSVDGEASTRLAVILAEPAPVPESRRNAAFIHNGYAHYAVREITSRPVDCLPVFNLEVETDESYTAYGVATHNCVEELATSAAEPRLVAMRKTGKGPQQLTDHPVLDLFERPNKWTSRYALIASLIMYRAIAGNAYLSKTRSASGKLVELWGLRPDRVFVIPDKVTHIAGWQYRLDSEEFTVPADDIIQSKTRNPMDDWYGLPPLAVCAERVDTDAMMRSFTLSFFRNAAVPAGLLQITKQVNQAEKQVIRDRFRMDTGGPQNWHSLMVMNDTEAKYTAMGMPLGASGIVLPELDEISEARIAMAFGVPLEVIGARLGMVHGNRSTMDAARATLWKETLIPLYQEIAADLTMGLADEYADTPDAFDYLEFDLSTVKALAEDEDAKHDRIRKDVEAGILSVQEARVILGHEPEYEPDALLMLGSRIQPMQATEAALGAPATPAQAPVPTTPNGNGNGKPKLTPADLQAMAELASGKENG